MREELVPLPETVAFVNSFSFFVFHNNAVCNYYYNKRIKLSPYLRELRGQYSYASLFSLTMFQRSRFCCGRYFCLYYIFKLIH